MLPAEYDRNDYKRTSLRDPRPELANSPQNQCGQKGVGRRPRVGRHQRPRRRAHRGARLRASCGATPIAWPTSPPPRTSTSARRDRRAAVRATATATATASSTSPTSARIADRNGNGLADPEDLILDPAFSNGVDDDRNGYVDDISGLGLPLRRQRPARHGRVRPRHRRGRGLDRGARTAPATSANCPQLPVPPGPGRRLVHRRRRPVRGGRAVRARLRRRRGPGGARRARQPAPGAAGDRRRVPSAASSWSRRWPTRRRSTRTCPASLEHTMAVNSVTEKEDLLGGGDRRGLPRAQRLHELRRAHVRVDRRRARCSSEATGQSAGHGRAARVRRPRCGRRRRTRRCAGSARGHERAVGQRGRCRSCAPTADDIDFSTPNAVDPANNFGTSDRRSLSTPCATRPAGLGRDVRLRPHQRLRDAEGGARPAASRPRPTIDGPAWFDVLPAHGHVDGDRHGRRDARRRSYDYRVEWAPGLQPPAYPATDTWHVAAERTDVRSPRHGTLAHARPRPDRRGAARRWPRRTGRPGHRAGPTRSASASACASSSPPTAAPATACRASSQKQVFVHDDPDLVAGYPRRIDGASHRAARCSPTSTAGRRRADRRDRRRRDPRVPTRDGRDSPAARCAAMEPVVAARSRATARTEGDPPAGAARSRSARRSSPTSTATGRRKSSSPTPTATSGRGRRTVAAARASRRPSSTARRTRPRTSTSPSRATRRPRRISSTAPSPASPSRPRSATSTATAASRSSPPRSTATSTRGTTTARPSPGFPVLARRSRQGRGGRPGTAQGDVHAGLRASARAASSWRRRRSPTSTGDGRPEIVIGAQEEYAETTEHRRRRGASSRSSALPATLGNSRLYAISSRRRATRRYPDRSAAHPDDQAYLPGWPVEARSARGSRCCRRSATASPRRRPSATCTRTRASRSSPRPRRGRSTCSTRTGHSVYGQVGGRRPPAPLGRRARRRGRGALRRRTATRTTSSCRVARVLAGPRSASSTATAHAGRSPRRPLGPHPPARHPGVRPPAAERRPADGAGRAAPATRSPGFPQVTADIAFFVTPAIADLDGDGVNEIDRRQRPVHARRLRRGRAPRRPGWPKLTGGWLVGTPGLGDWGGDGRAELAVVRRDGVLMVWHTQGAAAALTEWPRSRRQRRGTPAPTAAERPANARSVTFIARAVASTVAPLPQESQQAHEHHRRRRSGGRSSTPAATRPSRSRSSCSRARAGRAAVPSGASTGAHEAVELRDGGDRYGGKGVRQAVGARERRDPRRGDRPRRAPTSAASTPICSRSTAPTPRRGSARTRSSACRSRRPRRWPTSRGLPLYRYVGGANAHVLPVPLMNVLERRRARRQQRRRPGVHARAASARSASPKRCGGAPRRTTR